MSTNSKTRVISLVATLLLTSQAAAQEELCPSADSAGRTRGVVMNGVSVQAPASVEEEAALLKRMRSSAGDERRNTILALALGGNLETFDYLLGRGDADGLLVYAGNYLNGDGTLCLDAVIEDAILEHLQDPQLQRSLLFFLGKNLYRSRELFDGLRGLTASVEDPHDLRVPVMALVATNQDGVEEEMLALATSLLPHDTPRQKSSLPDVHRRFVEYFGRRGDPAAIPYLQELVRVEGYAETEDYFISKYSETRSLVYRALDAFPSELVGEVFLEQLELLVAAPRDVLTPYELYAFGERAVRHATTAEQKERLSDALDRLLEPAATDASIGYKTHERVLALQAAIATPSAAGRILDELERQVEGDDGFTNTLRSKAIHALAGLPVEVQLDVPRFLASAAKLPERERLLLTPQVLDRHPDPAGFAFYLSQLDWIVEASAETEPSFLARYWLEADAAFEIVFRGLLGFEDPELLTQTRDRLDALLKEEQLEVALYLSSSRELNRRLGDESPAYQELIQAQELAKLAERQARIAEKHVTWRREQEEIVAEHTSAEGIQRHIQTLSTSREGAVWLLIAGRDILPQAHEFLLDPAASLEAKVRLMDILSGIGDASSAGPIIAAARAADEPALLKTVFLGLGQLPPTQAASDFAAEQLEDGASPLAQRSALVYFAIQRDPDALDWARRYSAPGTDPDLRTAALFLAARLGDEQALPGIVELLEGERDRSREHALLRALAELTTPERFRELVPAGLQESAAYRTAARWSEFRVATGPDKTTLAAGLLEIGERWDRREAARYLLEEEQLGVLEDMLNVYPSVVYPLHAVILSSTVAQIILVEGRRFGVEIEWTPEGFRLVKG